jgi:hypothetical protein
LPRPGPGFFEGAQIHSYLFPKLHAQNHHFRCRNEGASRLPLVSTAFRAPMMLG